MKKKINALIENIKDGNYAELKRMMYVGLIILVVGLVGNVVFSLLTTDRSVLHSLTHFKAGYLILAACLALVPWITNTLRMKIWTSFLGHRFSFSNLLRITISIELGSALTPTAIGGGYVKAGMLMQRGLTVGKATSLLTVGSMENALFFTIALPIAVYVSKCWDLPIFRQIIEQFKQNIETGVLVILAVLIAVALFQLYKKMKGPGDRERMWLRLEHKIKEVVHDFIFVYRLIARNGKSRFALTMVLTAIQWISRYSILTALLTSFGVDTNPVQIFLFQWITFTLMTFIPTPGASAGAEASFYLVYVSFIPKAYLGLMTAGWRILTFYFTILLGVLVLLLFNIIPLILDRKKQSRSVVCQPSHH